MYVCVLVRVWLMSDTLISCELLVHSRTHLVLPFVNYFCNGILLENKSYVVSDFNALVNVTLK